MYKSLNEFEIKCQIYADFKDESSVDKKIDLTRQDNHKFTTSCHGKAVYQKTLQKSIMINFFRESKQNKLGWREVFFSISCINHFVGPLSFIAKANFYMLDQSFLPMFFCPSWGILSNPTHVSPYYMFCNSSMISSSVTPCPFAILQNFLNSSSDIWPSPSKST